MGRTPSPTNYARAARTVSSVPRVVAGGCGVAPGQDEEAWSVTLSAEAMRTSVTSTMAYQSRRSCPTCFGFTSSSIVTLKVGPRVRSTGGGFGVHVVQVQGAAGDGGQDAHQRALGIAVVDVESLHFFSPKLDCPNWTGEGARPHVLNPTSLFVVEDHFR